MSQPGDHAPPPTGQAASAAAHPAHGHGDPQGDFLPQIHQNMSTCGRIFTGYLLNAGRRSHTTTVARKSTMYLGKMKAKKGTGMGPEREL